MDIDIPKVKEEFTKLGLTEQDIKAHYQVADYAQEKIYAKFQEAIGKEHYKRRWLYELIQNAVDCSDLKVEVRVYLSSQNGIHNLEFEHNGGFFNPPKAWNKEHDFKNFILAKTGKTPTDESTGKFGTGFLSTHCLAHKIDIEGICVDDENNQAYRKVTIDREEFYNEDDESIQVRTLKIIKSLKEYDSNTLFDVSNKASAKFHYYLTESGLKSAKEGLTELNISIQYVFACNPTLEKITVINEGKTIIYQNEKSRIESGLLLHVSKVDLDERFTLIKNRSIENDGKSIDLLLLKSLNRTESGFEFIDTNLKYQEYYGKNMPSIYCSYPLIGSEDFQFPVIINSKKFKPNQERNGIQHNISSDLNDRIVLEAIMVYEDFVKEAIQFDIRNIHYILSTSSKFDFGENSWIDNEWYKRVIYSVRSKILSIKMIHTFSDPMKNVSILDESNNPAVYFLSNEFVKNLGNKLDAFVKEFSRIYQYLPLETEIRDWQSILWEDKSIVQIDLKAIIEKISSYKKLKGFADSLKSENEPETDDYLENVALSLINSLCEYITLCDPNNKDSYLSYKKEGQSFGFIPSRSGEFKLINELHKDVGCFTDLIGDELLDIYQKFFPKKIDYRSLLIHPQIGIKNCLSIITKEETVIQEILEGAENFLNTHAQIVSAMEKGNMDSKPKRDEIESILGDFWEWATEFDVKEKPYVKDFVRRKILQTIIDPTKSKFLTANLALDRSGKLSLERQSEILSDEDLNEKLILGQRMIKAINDENEKFEKLKKIGKHFEDLMEKILIESFGAEKVQHIDGNQDFIVDEKIRIELKSVKSDQIMMNPEQAETAQRLKGEYYLAVFKYQKDYLEVNNEEFKNGVRFTNDIGNKLDDIVVNLSSYESGDDNVQVLFPDVYKSFDGMKKYKYVIKKAAWGNMNFDAFAESVKAS